MLKVINKGQGVNQTEKRLIELANSAFIGLWSYPNVYSDEGLSKNKSGKEVCDLLVVFEDNVILFSVRWIAQKCAGKRELLGESMVFPCNFSFSLTVQVNVREVVRGDVVLWGP